MTDNPKRELTAALAHAAENGMSSRISNEFRAIVADRASVRSINRMVEITFIRDEVGTLDWKVETTPDGKAFRVTQGTERLVAVTESVVRLDALRAMELVKILIEKTGPLLSSADLERVGIEVEPSSAEEGDDND